ncbi:uncharacterized protein ARMOST_18676 [Armillaria ostoyae]|uniref:Uncharacterized protein n=1 Tax=Armillaria ostoyae TaxID=47428 RepID=A0A284S2F2_ARMOS|nr:uncharacterized protein ARMOST_18676 [Armillaria ostoyae]
MLWIDDGSVEVTGYPYAIQRWARQRLTSSIELNSWSLEHRKASKLVGALFGSFNLVPPGIIPRANNNVRWVTAPHDALSQTLSTEIHDTVMIEDAGRNQRLLVYARISVLTCREHNDDEIQCAWMVVWRREDVGTAAVRAIDSLVDM